MLSPFQKCKPMGNSYLEIPFHRKCGQGCSAVPTSALFSLQTKPLERRSPGNAFCKKKENSEWDHKKAISEIPFLLLYCSNHDTKYFIALALKKHDHVRAFLETGREFISRNLNSEMIRFYLLERDSKVVKLNIL